MNKRSLWLLIIPLSVVLTGACAQAGPPRVVQTGAGSNGQDPSAQQTVNYPHTAQVDAGEEDLEDRVRRVLGKRGQHAALQVGLDQDLLYKFLLAEIAGQRGDIALSSSTYLELARASQDVRVARRATEIAIYAKRDDIALETSRIWYENDPSAEQARRTLADLLVKSGDLESARPLLVQMLASSADGPANSLMQLYSVCGTHPDKSAVHGLVRDLTAPYIGLPEAHFVLAQSAYANGQRKQALKSADQAMVLRPDWQRGALLKAQLLREEDPEKGLKFLGKFVRDYPDAHEVRLNFARDLVAQKRYPQAKVQFQRLSEANPENSGLAFTLALLSSQISDYAAADAQLRQALSLGYENRDAVYFQLGQVNEKLKREDEAAKWYRSVQEGEQFVAAQARYALLLARRGGVDEARRYLQSVDVIEDSKRVQLIQAEAHMLREVREHQQSFEVLKEALGKRPGNTALLYDVALAAEKIDRIDICEEQLLKLIEIEPTSAQAYNALGYTLADRTDRFSDARDYIAKALALAPDDPFILDSMGWVEYRLGNLGEGLRFLRRAYDIQRDPEIAAHLGEVLWVKGSKAEAKRIWEDSSSAHPDNEVLQKTLRRFLGR